MLVGLNLLFYLENDAIISFMLCIATLITFICKIKTGDLVNTSTFKSGLSACICVLGVAWLGDTFVKGHIPEIKLLASNLVVAYPFLLAVALFFASMLLYSQAATTQALIPTVIVALGITPENTASVPIIVVSFAAVSALFVLPTYPTLLGAVQMEVSFLHQSCYKKLHLNIKIIYLNPQKRLSSLYNELSLFI